MSNKAATKVRVGMRRNAERVCMAHHQRAVGMASVGYSRRGGDMLQEIECYAVDPRLAQVVEKAFTLPPTTKVRVAASRGDARK